MRVNVLVGNTHQYNVEHLTGRTSCSGCGPEAAASVSQLHRLTTCRLHTTKHATFKRSHSDRLQRYSEDAKTAAEAEEKQHPVV